MTDYTKRLQDIGNRVNRRGNLDTVGMRELASIMWEMNERINKLEEAAAKPAPAPVVEKKVEEKVEVVEVATPEGDVEVSVEESREPTEDMSRNELIALADDLGVKLPNVRKLSKAQIVEKIKAA